MRVTLEIRTGPHTGRKIELQPGEAVRVGRRDPNNTHELQDSFLSAAHFALDCDERACRVRDLHSRLGTWLNGERVKEGVLRDGDELIAGQTLFHVHVEGAPPEAAVAAPAPEAASAAAAEHGGMAPLVVSVPALPPETPEEAALHDRVLEFLRSQPEPLFALVDAARDPANVLVLLHSSKEQFQSLYEGPQGDELAAAAPYLVSLPPGSPFLERLVRWGWGKSWGVYLTCSEPFKAVRKHFRRFLLVKTEEGKELYFRYYDPRVLRVFLPTCNSEELAKFFGPIQAFWMEAPREGVLLRCEFGEQKLKQEPVRLQTKT